MKKLITVILVALSAASILADGTKKINPILRKTGGMIQRPGVKQGVIAIVNTQTKVNSTNFVSLAKSIERTLHVLAPIKNVALSDCSSKTIDDAFKNAAADFAVIVVDNPSCITALSVYPEKRYSVVNVSELGKDCPNEAFLRSRTSKEISRALLFIIGGASSLSQFNVMGPVFKPSDLDKVGDEAIPVDVVGRVLAYLPACGCETHAFVSYRKACQEGWAPQPTNEYQKAIWEKVHAIPDKPMKIQFDPAAQKGKVTK